MNTRPTLYKQLQKYILPRLLTALGVVSIVLCLCIFYVAKEQISSGHQANIQHLQRDLDATVDNTQQLMEGIAANDLLINSFIDAQQRQNYLPVFFQSLRFTRATTYSLGLFQFDGSLLIEHNWQEQIPSGLSDVWQETVLSQSTSFSRITDAGVLIAVPVLIADVAEGALVLFTPSLQELIYERDTGTYQLILSSNNEILYSSHPETFPLANEFAADKYASWVSETSQWQGLTLISLAPALSAFANVLWLIPAILITLGAAVLVSFYATNRAARLSASMLRHLHDDIQHGTGNRSRTHSAVGATYDTQEARELNEIRRAFNNLVSNLTSVSLSNKQFSNVIDSLEEILVVLDEENRQILSNRSFTQYTLNYALTATQLLDVQQKLAGEKQFLSEVYPSLSDRTPVTINWSALPLLDDNRTQVGTILVGNDVTKQKVLEKRINVISHAIKAATVPILIADAKKDGYPIIYANPYFSEVSGFSENEVLGQQHLLMDKMLADPAKAATICAALETGRSCDETMQCHRKDNSSLYVQVIITPVFAENELEHFVVFFQDVTEREQAQRFLEDARLRAEESARLKSGFLASMSHEVRTPLHGVSGALQLVNKTTLDKSQQRYVDLADESIKNLQHIVDDILDFSKIEAGQLKLEQVPFNLQLLLETLYEQFTIISTEKGVNLKLESKLHDHTMVVGDPVRFRQVLSNLLSNAVKFTPHGHITLSVALISDNHQWHIEGAVTDSGIGIDQENLDSIFDVFRQEDTSTTRKFGGTGLGLSISRQLCRLMDGDLTVSSQKGKGSRFAFTMKAMQVTSPQIQLPAKQSDAAQPLTSGDNKAIARILIVEDNEINQLIAREHLSGHKTLTAKNGVEALAALNRVKLKFDLILMDCHMPEMDGFETTRRIRAGEAGERYVNVPIIALTANAMKGDRERCEAAGMDDYISKPFSATKLLGTIARFNTPHN